MRKFIIPMSVFFISFSAYAAAPDLVVELSTHKATGPDSPHGRLRFKDLGNHKIHIFGTVQGLAPGKHGMHIHSVGDCGDPMDGFHKSGPHFSSVAPTQLAKPRHGSLGGLNSHTGDLGNILADQKGLARVDMMTDKFSVSHESPRSIIGKALIVHAGEDDERTDPAGNSGERILCGVIHQEK